MSMWDFLNGNITPVFLYTALVLAMINFTLQAFFNHRECMANIRARFTPTEEKQVKANALPDTPIEIT